MSKQNKFSRTLASATDIGRKFGLSAIAVNRLLAEEGLRDVQSKAPTPRALSEGWALATPLRNGISHYMWSRRKLEQLLARSVEKLDSREVAFEAFARTVLSLEREAEELGTDKLLYFFVDQELGSVRDTPPEMVERVCRRLGCAARTEEFIKLVGRSKPAPQTAAQGSPGRPER